MADKKAPVALKEHNRYLIIGLMMPGSVDRVIAVLVKRGYTVAPLSSARSAYLAADDNMVTLLTLNITGAVPEDVKDPSNHIYEDVKDVLKVTSTKHYMMYLGEPAGCKWGLGNVTKEATDALNVTPYRTPGKDVN